MLSLMTIRDFCERFVAEHGMSMASLAMVLGYRSTTSLYRIMDDSVRPSSLTGFQNSFAEAFALSDDEKKALSEAISLKMYGSEKAAAYQAMSSFLIHAANCCDAVP